MVLLFRGGGGVSLFAQKNTRPKSTFETSVEISTTRGTTQIAKNFRHSRDPSIPMP